MFPGNLECPLVTSVILKTLCAWWSPAVVALDLGHPDHNDQDYQHDLSKTPEPSLPRSLTSRLRSSRTCERSRPSWPRLSTKYVKPWPLRRRSSTKSRTPWPSRLRSSKTCERIWPSWPRLPTKYVTPWPLRQNLRCTGRQVENYTALGTF